MKSNQGISSGVPNAFSHSLNINCTKTISTASVEDKVPIDDVTQGYCNDEDIGVRAPD